MAERKGSAFRRRLRSAERLSEAAMRRALANLKTPLSRSRASLVCITRRDHLRVGLAGAFDFAGVFVRVVFWGRLRADWRGMVDRVPPFEAGSMHRMCRPSGGKLVGRCAS